MFQKKWKVKERRESRYKPH